MNENNLKIEKIQKSSKIAFRVTNVVKVFGIIGAVILIIAGCIVIGGKDTLNRELGEELKEGFTVEEFSDSFGGRVAYQMIESGAIAEGIGLYCLEMSMILIFMAVVLHFVGRVFKSFMESYSPFQPGIVKNLKVTFVLITIAALSSSLGIGLIIGFAAWCVINIFEYGCELQRQSDETL